MQAAIRGIAARALPTGAEASSRSAETDVRLELETSRPPSAFGLRRAIFVVPEKGAELFCGMNVERVVKA